MASAPRSNCSRWFRSISVVVRIRRHTILAIAKYPPVSILGLAHRHSPSGVFQAKPSSTLGPHLRRSEAGPHKPCSCQSRHSVARTYFREYSETARNLCPDREHGQGLSERLRVWTGRTTSPHPSRSPEWDRWGSHTNLGLGSQQQSLTQMSDGMLQPPTPSSRRDEFERTLAP